MNTLDELISGAISDFRKVAALADEAFIFDSITIEVMVKPHRSPTKLAADGGLGDEK